MESRLIENFVWFLRQFVAISDDEVKNFLLPVVILRKFKKRELITQAGEVENFINYIEQGLVLKYYKQGDEEKVVQVSIEGHLVSCEESLYTRNPSEFYLEAVEPTTLISISYEDLERVFASSHNFERLGRLVVTYIMVLKGNWQTNLIKQSPRERFLNFFENYPEILQRVPQKYLASYLNIQPETFSRFKHLVRNEVKPENHLI
ncbi:MAG TPA: Crp/Fnr family transcriptional regulator [Niabella sp.]|jgi:CRP-like cAMP-binding protein|nr:Crp/Fnr family transcriptional regulator [Chitinophagaceae bacterium]HRN49375.1 Crp/Fnr family transcriptional regulator [Niabella sp.]HRO83877.1 Crp/Fnr family transcriptional regulator [Niabella sp.]